MQRKHRLCSRLSTFLNLDFHLTTFEMVNIPVRDIDILKVHAYARSPPFNQARCFCVDA